MPIFAIALLQLLLLGTTGTYVSASVPSVSMSYASTSAVVLLQQFLILGSRMNAN